MVETRSDRKARQAAKREQKRRVDAAIAQARADEEARKQEVADEAVAPAIQRAGVTRLVATGGGREVVQHARVVRDGVAFRVHNPINRLVQRSAVAGFPTITAGHAKAAERLAIAWEEGGKGVGIGASQYGERSSSTPQTGIISDAMLAIMRRQIAAEAECAQARHVLGPLWEQVRRIALEGMDVSAWAATRSMRREVALGRLAAALDQLCAYYAAKDRVAERGRIRGAQVVERVRSA